MISFSCGFNLALVVPHGAPLFPVVHLLAQDKLRKVDLVAVEFGPVDADELRLAADGGAAAPAHAGTVHHDGVEAHHGLEVVGTRHFGHRLHHDDRAYPDHEVDLFRRVLRLASSARP